ncbi:MAG: hypothetical protein ACYC1C_13440 [Chloroflexota bacterium]
MRKKKPDRSRLPAKGISLLAFAQGLYYLVTGLWPLVHMPSFLAITGPKTDLWLVRSNALLIAAIGLALSLAGLRREGGLSTGSLGIGAAAALGGVDATYALRGRISRAYLLDVPLEAAFALGWALAGLRRVVGRP